jgi:hypothetical protein
VTYSPSDIQKETFNYISSHTINNVLTELQDFDDNPDVAFDFFGLCKSLIRLSKKIFFDYPYLEELMNTWIIGIGSG